MIPYDLDPSLHAGAPESTMLDDGFSPPLQETGTPENEPLPDSLTDAPAVDPALWAKSAF